jgi:hypothetical protein
MPFWVRGGGSDEFFADMLAWDCMVFDVEVYGGHFSLACLVRFALAIGVVAYVV